MLSKEHIPLDLYTKAREELTSFFSHPPTGNDLSDRESLLEPGNGPNLVNPTVFGTRPQFSFEILIIPTLCTSFTLMLYFMIRDFIGFSLSTCVVMCCVFFFVKELRKRSLRSLRASLKLTEQSRIQTQTQGQTTIQPNSHSRTSQMFGRSKISSNNSSTHATSPATSSSTPLLTSNSVVVGISGATAPGATLSRQVNSKTI